jgi:hypothetical protein
LLLFLEIWYLGTNQPGGNIMTKDSEGHFAQKHPSNSETDPQVVSALKERASEGGIPCAVAFRIASDLNVTPGLVGKTADMLELRLKKCQLGLFGYEPNKRIVKPAEAVSKELEARIQKGLTEGRLSCKTAWEIAEESGLTKMAVAAACEHLGLKITACQLGAF